MRRRTVAVACWLTALSFALAQWEPDRRLTNNAGWSYLSAGNAWCVAASGGCVHVVWYDRSDFNYEIYYKRSTDAGATWEADTRLTRNNLNSEFPAVVVNESIISVVWQDDRAGDYEVYYKRSTDAGLTWGADTSLTNSNRDSRVPSIAARGSVIHVVWQDERDGNREVYYKRSTDDGATWDADTRLTTDGDSSLYPSVATSESTVHVVWLDKRDGRFEVCYKRSADCGGTWGSDIRLSDSSYVSAYPSVGASGSAVHVVWEDYRDGNADIYYKRSTDDGVTWDTDTRLTDDSSYSYSPSLAVGGGVVHAVWRDGRDGNDEIYYKRSTDAGSSWELDTRLTDNSAQSRRASATVGGSSVHVVWSDTRDGNPEIYYKRNPYGSVAVSESPEQESRWASTAATIVRGMLFLPEASGGKREARGELLDISGRKVQDLKPGANDVSGLPAGVYFVCSGPAAAAGEPSALAKAVIRR